MSTLTQRLERPLQWPERRLRLSKLRRARLKRIALHGLALLSMGSVLTVLIALRTAILCFAR